LCGEFVGMLGIQPSEFWNMTPKEGYNAMKTKSKLIENDTRLQYELTRLNIFYLINIQLDLENRMRKPEDLMMFSWETKELEHQIDEMTEDRWLELDKKYEKSLLRTL
jgi:hypothetical protein